jgi:hypothetical protein
MDDIWAKLETLWAVILWPMRVLMQAVGLHPIDIQVWAMMVTVFMVAIYAPTTYGDWVLSRRRLRTTGEVIEIERSSDSPDTPRIGFYDRHGVRHDFSSPLPINTRTEVVGNQVEVIYDPLHPWRAREAGRWLMKGTQAVLWYAIAISLALYAVGAYGPA